VLVYFDRDALVEDRPVSWSPRVSAVSLSV